MRKNNEKKLVFITNKRFSSFCDCCRLLVFLSVVDFFSAEKEKKVDFIEFEVNFDVAKVK